MSDLIIDNISLMIFIPFWVFLIILCGRSFGVYINKIIVYILTLSASLFGVIVSFAGLEYLNSAVEKTLPFIKINDFTLSYGIFADKYSFIFSLLLFSVSFFVQLYSVSYMKNERKNYRFFAYLNMFNCSMAALLFSPNLYQVYVFWEIVGVISYLLIGFNYYDGLKSTASKRVFIVNRIGDTALISAIIISSYYMFNYANNLSLSTLSLSDLGVISTMLSAYSSTPEFLIICSLFIFGAIVKSAQYPFHIWLQDAMEASLPVSALLHSATMVVAGIYLVIRLMPFFVLNPILLKLILAIGVLTAVICSLLASFESDLKKILAYSTSANLGLVFVALGLNNIKAAMIFLLAHAIVKSMLFLSLPKDKKISPIMYGTLIIGTLSLSGIILSGFISKEFLYTCIENKILKIIFLLVSFMTAYYMTRLCFLVKNHLEEMSLKHSGFAEIFSVAGLLAFNVVIAFKMNGLNYEFSYPFIAATIAICFCTVLYKFNLLEKVNLLPKLSEVFAYKFLPYLYEKFTNLILCAENCVFSNYKPLCSAVKSFVKFSGYIEEKIMNKSVKKIADISDKFSVNDSKLQSGNVQTYNAYAFIIATVILFLICAVYIILIKIGGN